jgi:hypothetical protein
MTRVLRIGVTLGLLAALTAGASTASAAAGGNHKVFDATMIGLPAARVVLAGVTGAGHAWAIEHGNAKIFSDGRVLVNVEGLVLTPEGNNPVPTGRAVVSCNGGASADDIVMSDIVPFSMPDGDAHVNQHLDLPSPCANPVVFFTNNAGAWFAATD